MPRELEVVARVPSAPSWAPNDTQNRPSGAKKHQKKHKTVLTFADLFPRSLLERSWPPFGIIFDGFGKISNGCWHHFFIFYQILGINLGHL